MGSGWDFFSERSACCASERHHLDWKGGEQQREPRPRLETSPPARDVPQEPPQSPVTGLSHTPNGGWLHSAQVGTLCAERGVACWTCWTSASGEYVVYVQRHGDKLCKDSAGSKSRVAGSTSRNHKVGRESTLENMLHAWRLIASLMLCDIISKAKLVTPLNKIISPLRNYSCMNCEFVSLFQSENSSSPQLMMEKCSEQSVLPSFCTQLCCSCCDGADCVCLCVCVYLQGTWCLHTGCLWEEKSKSL